MRHRRIRGRRAARTGIPAAPRRFRPARRGCGGRGRAASAANRCCGCRTRRRPTGPCCSTASRSFCARQPPTAICMSGSACLRGARWLRLPYSLLSAFSRTAQVLNTTTSASVPSAARSVSGGLQQPGQPLGVVHIHLAAVGADLIGARRASANGAAGRRLCVTIEVTAPWYGRVRRDRRSRADCASSRQAGRSLGKVCTHGDTGRM